MAPRRPRLAALIVGALLLACGCSDDDRDEQSTGDTTGAGELADGRHFGRVTALEPAKRRLAFDLADLDGDRVDDAEAVVVRLPIADDVEVRLLDPCCELSDASFETWLDGFEPDERSFYTTSRSYYWVTLADGQVTAVEEQYIAQ